MKTSAFSLSFKDNSPGRHFPSSSLRRVIRNVSIQTHMDKASQSSSPAIGCSDANVKPRIKIFLKSCQLMDVLTEVILYSMMIFSPWAFGTTQDWAISVMNVAGFALGIFLLVKWIIRWRFGSSNRGSTSAMQPRRYEMKPSRNFPKLLTRLLAFLTCAVLLYCAISALNARAIYHNAEQRFEYRDHFHWLPHSYDRRSTWQAFENYLALAFVFWGVRDWLRDKTSLESRSEKVPKQNPQVLPVR